MRATGCRGFCSRGPVVVVEPTATSSLLPDASNRATSPTSSSGRSSRGEVVERLTYRDDDGDASSAPARHPVLLRPGRSRHAQLRQDRPHRHRRLSSRATATRRWPRSSATMTPGRGHRRGQGRSGLRGRGGAGFPDGRQVGVRRASSRATTKYVICNADEGDPGAFMDRGVLEGDPHAVLEGMIIGAYAIGAARGLRLLPRRVPARHRAPAHRHRAGRGAAACSATTSSAPASPSTSRSRRAPAPSSAARRRR